MHTCSATHSSSTSSLDVASSTAGTGSLSAYRARNNCDSASPRRPLCAANASTTAHAHAVCERTRVSTVHTGVCFAVPTSHQQQHVAIGACHGDICQHGRTRRCHWLRRSRCNHLQLTMRTSHTHNQSECTHPHDSHTTHPLALSCCGNSCSGNATHSHSSAASHTSPAAVSGGN
jgi:hypothetical protein